jgi:type IV pilus assembly protein PilO
MEQALSKLVRTSLVQKWAILALVAAILIGIGYILIIVDKIAQVDEAIAAEEPLKQEFKEKLNKARNLDVYRKQLNDIEKRFADSLKQLPSKTEMEGLLSDVNQAGVNRGLGFELFKPSATENMTEVYAELPVSIKVLGNYDDFGLFAADVAKLPRIVTLNDIKITQNNMKIKGMEDKRLTMEVTANIYRYLDDQERQKQVAAARDLKRKKAPPKEEKGEK